MDSPAFCELRIGSRRFGGGLQHGKVWSILSTTPHHGTKGIYFNMFKRIANAIAISYRQETLSERSARMLPGALYGALGATAYALTFSTINVVTFAGLHLSIDWIRLLTFWGGFGAALALAGAIVGWFTEEYTGIVGGGIVMTVLILAGNLIFSLASGNSAEEILQSFVATLPTVGAAILLAAGLRVAINRHLHIKQSEPPESRRKLLAGLVGIVFLVGWIPGALTRYDSSTVEVLRTLNESLKSDGTVPASDSRLPIAKLPALKDHLGMNYRLYPRASVLSTGAMDITIRFEDGYTLTCNVPTGGGGQVYFTDCNEGQKITGP
jgi:hypothetical protein